MAKILSSLLIQSHLKKIRNKQDQKISETIEVQGSKVVKQVIGESETSKSEKIPSKEYDTEGNPDNGLDKPSKILKREQKRNKKIGEEKSYKKKNKRKDIYKKMKDGLQRLLTRIILSVKSQEQE